MRAWRMQEVVPLESGQPFNVLLPNDNSNTGRLQDFPDLVVGKNPNNGPKTVSQWFDSSAFQTPLPFTLGNAGKTITVGPPNRSFDFTLNKNFKVKEQHRVHFRVEFFNILKSRQFVPAGQNIWNNKLRCHRRRLRSKGVRIEVYVQETDSLPLERPLEDVGRDVVDGLISRETALKVSGVVMTEDLLVDIEATEQISKNVRGNINCVAEEAGSKVVVYVIVWRQP